MARIGLAEGAAHDLDRILDHLLHFEVEQAPQRVREIIAALDVLEHNPQIGRPAGDGKRELVIGRGSRGYVALYADIEHIDTVFVLAVRSQREAGYG